MTYFKFAIKSPARFLALAIFAVFWIFSMVVGGFILLVFAKDIIRPMLKLADDIGCWLWDWSLK